MVWFFNRHYGGEISNSSALSHISKHEIIRRILEIWKTYFFKIALNEGEGMEVKHQIQRYSDGQSASGPMFIRGSPCKII